MVLVVVLVVLGVLEVVVTTAVVDVVEGVLEVVNGVTVGVEDVVVGVVLVELELDEVRTKYAPTPATATITTIMTAINAGAIPSLFFKVNRCAFATLFKYAGNS